MELDNLSGAYVVVVCLEKVSCCLGWPPTYYKDEDDPHATTRIQAFSPTPLGVVLEMIHKAVYVPGKHSTS